MSVCPWLAAKVPSRSSAVKHCLSAPLPRQASQAMDLNGPGVMSGRTWRNVPRENYPPLAAAAANIPNRVSADRRLPYVTLAVSQTGGSESGVGGWSSLGYLRAAPSHPTEITPITASLTARERRRRRTTWTPTGQPSTWRDAGYFRFGGARTPAVPAIDVPLRECPHGRTRVPLRPRRGLCVVLRATPRRRAGADR
jgi:hypothetical protein